MILIFRDEIHHWLIWCFHFVEFFTLLRFSLWLMMVFLPYWFDISWWNSNMFWSRNQIQSCFSLLERIPEKCSKKNRNRWEGPFGPCMLNWGRNFENVFKKNADLAFSNVFAHFFCSNKWEMFFSRLVRWNNVSVKNSSANNFGTLLFWWNWKLIADKKKIKRVYVYGKWLFHFETSSKKKWT